MLYRKELTYPGPGFGPFCVFDNEAFYERTDGLARQSGKVWLVPDEQATLDARLGAVVREALDDIAAVTLRQWAKQFAAIPLYGATELNGAVVTAVMRQLYSAVATALDTEAVAESEALRG